MGWASAQGRTPWVLAGGLLAAALVLPAGEGRRDWLPEGPGPRGRPGAALPPRDHTAAPAPGAGPEPAAQVLPGAPRPCAETPRRGTAVETPFRRNRTRERGASDPPPTSAASRGPGAPSARALIPVWPRKTVSKRDAPLTRRPYGERPREAQGAAENTVVFQKCAVVSGPQGAQTAQVQLLVNNTRTPAATALSDLLLLDNITGLHVGGWPGNRTADGLQAFSRQFLQVGDALLISYTASLDARGLGSGAVLTLPARLSFSTSTKNRTQLEAPFTLTVEEKLQVLPDHGLHAAAFFSAFLGSLALACLALFVLRCRCWAGAVLSRRQVQHHENKLEHSQFTSADGVNEDLALDDQMINILCSEDPESMLQALEELEVATLNRADSDLEARRAQISKDVVALLLRSLSGRGHLAPQAERRMAAVFKKQFLLLEKEVQEEYDRKMVAVTAECDLDMRKKTERQHQREMAAMEEAEELLKRSGDRSAAQCSSLLRTLHSLEREQLHRSLALQQEEDVARARRQLAVFQRNELHGLFFTQIRGAISKGELQPEAAKGLLQEYARTQEDVEELMDFLQASKRFHLSKRFGHREYLVQSLRSSDTRVQGLLEAAAAQLSALIQKHERAGYLDEDQMDVLLERAQTEVFAVKQKLDNDLKQEKRKLCQKLITKRRRELLQKHKEQRKERLALGDAPRAAEDVGQYLAQWRGLLAEQGAALEELQERLDQAALDELRALTRSLSEKAGEELGRLQGSALSQELLKRSAPWLFLQQILEEHGQEMAARAEQLEAEERDRGQEGVRGVRRRLKDDAPEASVEEQAELRRWERLVFAKLCTSPLSLSEEESLRAQQEVHGCFAQMDRSLALPRIRAQVLLQQCQTAWREAECLRLDEALAAPEQQHPPKARKSRSKSKIGLLKKSLEDKIQLFEEQAPDDLLEKVRGELRGERVRQLEAQEARFVGSLVSLQFQKAARMARTLRAYAALLSTQDLLLEGLSASETLTKAACAQILGSHGPELQELERKLEDKLAHQEAAWRLQAPHSGQQWAGDGSQLLTEPDAGDSDGQVSAVLQRALSLAQRCLRQYQQGAQEERQRAAALEDLLEKAEHGTFVALHGQELRLASYLARLTMVPGATLRRLLSVALPTASQPELLALLDSITQKHPDHMAESDPGEQADPGRRGRHQSWWRALESELRGDLRSSGAEKMLWARRRKESILEKTCPPLGARVLPPGGGGWPRLALEPAGELAPAPAPGAQAVGRLDTGERLFVFRSPAEPEIALRAPARRKKKNFLNAKKAAWALAAD